MAKDLFSIPIFFIVFREALEAVIIIAVLLSLVEGIVRDISPASTTTRGTTSADHEKAEHSKATTGGSGDHGEDTKSSASASGDDNNEELDRRAIVKKMRIQIFAGALAGLFVALAIGAAFIAVWFTQVRDLFGANEEVWEGVFNLIASILIFVMGLTMLRIDTAKKRWRVKIEAAFAAKANSKLTETDKREGKGVKFVLFTLPFITVMREGLEAVVFIGGVSLGQQATAIPIAAIVGLLVGLIIGFIIYKSSSRLGLSIFLIVSTWFLLLVGSGLFSKAVGNFQQDKFNKIVGGDVAEAGTGPGSYSVQGNIWHLNCCSPEDKFNSKGWGIFAALFGWSNDGSVGTVLAYIFYWWAAIVALVYMKWREGRLGKKRTTTTE
ncbi:high-affinity iron permease [Serendipita sp. 396]|nr:high-affinity iron permease [Serendipita sp. 396]KAG8798490.1 high-affinity iron permease [Serendipita sp. 398]KAG8862858.1 high-affinity iron permease [Serendipita sp. 405]